MRSIVISAVFLFVFNPLCAQLSNVAFNKKACGLNYVSASGKITNRHAAGGPGRGLPAAFTITGLPDSAYVIEQAFLWHEESYTATSPTEPATRITNPDGVQKFYVPFLAGKGGEKCWGEVGTRVWRTDLTSSVSGNGVYIFNTNTPAATIDGATLIIIYRDLKQTYEGTLVINDGNITVNSGLTSASATLKGFNACEDASEARGFMAVGDFQLATHTSTINGTPLVFPDLFWNFDEAITTVNAGQTTSNFGTRINGIDCYTWALMGLYYQTNCSDCDGLGVVDCDIVPDFNADTVCVGTETTFQDLSIDTGGASIVSWAWDFGDGTTAVSTTKSTTHKFANPGVYSVSLKVNNDKNPSCSQVAFKDIIVSEPPTISTTPDTNVCANRPVVISAKGGFNYKWTPNIWLTKDSGETVISRPLASVTYTVSATDSFGVCAPIKTPIKLIITPKPLAPKVTCLNEANGDILFSWPTSPNQDYEVSINGSNTWESPNGLGGTTDPNHLITANNADEEYELIVKAIRPNSCEFSYDTLTCSTPICPDGSFTLSGPDSVSKGQLFDISLFFQNPDDANDYFFTMDSTIEILGGSIKNLSQDSTKWWRVTGVNKNLSYCPIIKDSILIPIINECKININTPNAFSPNNDGMNDIWVPIISCAREVNLAVFNRWGERIFQSQVAEEGWSGINQLTNSISSNGVYLYLLTAIDQEGKTHRFSNIVNITN